MNKELKVAVIGLGQGWHHAKAYQKVEGIVLVRLCDVNTDRLYRAMREFSVPDGTTDLSEIVQDPTIDLVSICTPNHLHYEHALPLLQSGKHVLIEKPMTTRLDQALELVDLAYKKGCLISVGMVLRFVPSFYRLVAWLRQERLGRIFYIEGRYLHDVKDIRLLLPSHQWWREAEMLFAGGVHPLDLMMWAMGDINEVYALANHTGNLPELRVPDQIVMLAKFRHGAIGKVWTNVGINGGTGNTLTVAGQKGTVHADPSGWEVYLSDDIFQPPYGKAGYWRIPFQTDGSPLDALIQDVCWAIREGRQPLITGTDGARCVAVLEAGVRSYQTGEPQKVPSV
ncbi:MAG: Gfo/Idh/MocA family oxidoreductase [Armatimonadetes bacterium]|nr:Gfo/Idh/MocA family oxidoreductase [Armatimonadota bacterium]MDW8120725.1 Gfo/Idh/MocA family oxidoreductase [Armatimonadota bacterium]